MECVLNMHWRKSHSNLFQHVCVCMYIDIYIYTHVHIDTYVYCIDRWIDLRPVDSLTLTVAATCSCCRRITLTITHHSAAGTPHCLHHCSAASGGFVWLPSDVHRNNCTLVSGKTAQGHRSASTARHSESFAALCHCSAVSAGILRQLAKDLSAEQRRNLRAQDLNLWKSGERQKRSTFNPHVSPSSVPQLSDCYGLRGGGELSCWPAWSASSSWNV